MDTGAASGFGIGQPVRRTEDHRLLTGAGRYTEDYTPANCAYGYVLRSPHAHARIRSIDTTAASSAAGVIAALTGADYDADGLGYIETRTQNQRLNPKAPPRPPVAADTVRHVGEPVAFVVAESLDQAKDAAELIVVDYEVLSAIAETGRAMDADAPKVWAEQMSDNVCFRYRSGNREGVEAAFKKAAHITTIRIYNNRMSANPMEPRAAVAEYDRWSGRVTLTSGAQDVHGVRQQLAEDIFRIPAHNVRVVAQDMGGGFGMRVCIFPEQVLVCWAARRVNRPVKWVADRSESFLSDYHARDNVTEAALALSADGTFLGIKVRTIGALGAYLAGTGPVPLITGLGMLQGLYRTAAIFAEVDAVLTHTLPTCPYRGAGRPENTYILERLIDKAAIEMGLDRIALRRQNLIPAEAIPFKGMEFTYDSGDFPRILQTALEKADVAGFAARRDESKRHGKLRGLGLANYIERCGAAGSEFAQVRLDSGGSATVMMGTKNHGQGHETVFAQMASQALGIPFEKVRILDGDTDIVSFGRGSWGSRSMAIGGSALKLACDRVIDRAKTIAGHALEAAVDDIDYADGVFVVKGTDRKITLNAVCKMAYPGNAPPQPFELGLDEQAHYSAPGLTFPNGTHVVEVEVDPETGRSEILRYTVIDDFGVEVNPLLLHGQVHGGIVQGASQVLGEDVVYDRNGQLLTGSFMDYAMPRADEYCSFEIETRNTRAKNNLLGVKGAGESSTVGALPAVMSAILDALGPYGITDLPLPATPERVWQAISRWNRSSRS